MKAYVEENRTSLSEVVVVVHGHCPTGADHFADDLDEQQGVTSIERYPADWERHGKRAGFIRNSHMVALSADICFAFIKDESKGATMTARIARLAGIPTIEVTL